MSLANKMAGAARVAVDNARKTADQALHDRAELRRRVGSTVRDAPLTAVRYTIKGVGQALSLGGRVRQGLGDVRTSGVGGAMTRFTRRDTEEKPGTAPGATETGRSAFEKAATETPADEPPRPEGVRPARRPRSARTGEAPATPAADAKAAEGTEPKAADATEAKGAASAAESSANAVAAAGSPAASRTPAPGEADTKAAGSGIGGSGETGTGGGGAELPVPEYDSRSVPSLRARMRGLSVDDIRRLLEYEHNHAARPEVIGMFERRITKLESE